MLTKYVRWQLLIFLVIALLGVSYVGATYVGLHKLFIDTGYTVKAHFVSGGGVFSNGEVTYRGVGVGRVGDLRLTETGMEADLEINPEAPKIPADTKAVVANRSAAGEQYVDLRPFSSDGPNLKEGSVIEQDRTDIPLPVDQVLANMDALVESVPKADLRTVVDELYKATSGAGPNLEALLDSGIDFIDAADRHLPQFTNLVKSSETVLQTQAEQADAIRSFSAQTRVLAEQLKNSDSDIRGLITKMPPAAREISSLIQESGPNLGVLMANLLSTSKVLEVRQDGLEQLLVKAPQAVAVGSQAVREDGAHFGLSLTFFDPLPCTQGYQGTQYRDGLDVSAGPPLNVHAQCTLPAGSDTGVRGSQNVPEPR